METVALDPGRRTKQLILFGCLLILSLIWLMPFVTVFITAIRSQGDLISRGVFVMPKAIQWGNFSKAWSTGDFSTYFRNSLFLIAFKVPIGIFIASLAAYPLAKMRFRLSMPIFVFFLAGLAIPVQVTLQPLLIMMKQIGISNSLFALIPPYIAFGLPFQVFVMRGFFRLIPSELLEASRIDGASEFSVFWRIMLPLSLPALATLAIVDVLATWNEFLIALVLISGNDARTVPLGLLQFQGEHSSNYVLLMAGIVISIVPVIAIFVFLQRYFISGLTSGAVKG